MPKIGYREIAEDLRRAIGSGEFMPGAAFPSEATVAEQHGVTRTTARRALALLEELGLIITVAGRGRYVGRGPGASHGIDSKFEQVAASLRERVGAPTQGTGNALGTEAALANEFDVSQGTVRRALQQLEAEGLAAAVPGRGWFVRDDAESHSRTGATAGEIRAALAAGEWREGERLPGEEALARRFGVGRVTVRRALARLEADGLLDRQPGRGRVVLARPTSETG